MVLLKSERERNGRSSIISERNNILGSPNIRKSLEDLYKKGFSQKSLKKAIVTIFNLDAKYNSLKDQEIVEYLFKLTGIAIRLFSYPEYCKLASYFMKMSDYYAKEFVESAPKFFKNMMVIHKKKPKEFRIYTPEDFLERYFTFKRECNIKIKPIDIVKASILDYRKGKVKRDSVNKVLFIFLSCMRKESNRMALLSFIVKSFMALRMEEEASWYKMKLDEYKNSRNLHMIWKP